MKLRRGLLAALAVLVALVVASSAQAAIPSVYGGAAPCSTLSSNGNIRLCKGYVLTWDHTKIDVNVFLPAETGGTEGPYPTIGDFHGWGSAKQGLNEVPPAGGGNPGGFLEGKDPRIQHWAEEGYAVFSMSDRGWGLSCGHYDPSRENHQAICEKGYNHLMDDRYEVRDAQFLLGELADEGIVQPKKIGATGVSYGGAMSLALAALRNRTMLQNGSLVPWTSPVKGIPMELAAAVPQWPWSDLAYALAPNGRNLDYVTESPYRGPAGKYPVGVWKASFSEYLYKAGELLSNYATGTASEPEQKKEEAEANIPGWILRLKAGEPYTDAGINSIIQQLTTYHSAYYINSSVEPSPSLIQSGWNDDLFPVDEALRYYQSTRAQYPSDPISLYLADIGHSRSQNKEPDVAAFNARLDAWFARYLKDEGASPTSSVEAWTTTCPKTAASGGPLKASNWSGLAPGEIRLQSGGTQTLEHGTTAEEETPTESSAFFDPIIGPREFGKNLCSSANAADQPRTLNYRLAAAPTGGFTLMGSPTIIADVESPSPNSEIAARLVDVAPGGTETLIARGLYRPTGGSQEMVFQLHPQAYHFAEGHVAKLELLPSDFPYGRFSNLQNNITVSDLELRLPVTEAPGSLGGLVQTPAPKVVPAGYTLAEEFQTKSSGGGGGDTGGGGGNSPSPKPAPAPVKIGAGGFAGKFSANRKVVIVPVRCAGEGACSGQVSISVKKPGGKGRTVLAKGSYSIGQGATSTVRLPLTKAGRKIVKSNLGSGGSRTLSGVVNLVDTGRPSLILKRPVHLTGGK